VIAASPRVFARRVAALSLIAGLTLGASGCGRYGPLEPPPNASAAAAKPPDDPTATLTHHKEPPITPPTAPFVLDPLL